MSQNLKDQLSAMIAEKFKGGEPIGEEESLFYSGLIDSLGIAAIATFLSKATGKSLDATEIVEEDLDTISLLVAWAEG